METHRRWVLGISGASGAVYGVRLLQELCAMGYGVDLILSEAAKTVIREEMGIAVPSETEAVRRMLADALKVDTASLEVYGNGDFETPPASGSYRSAGMVVAPCSMGTLAALAQGLANNLIRRAGDVMLKEKRPLILVPRESPLSAIHLENMLTLSRVGAVIVPPMPAFYQGPQTVDDLIGFVVGRVLDVMGIEHRLFRRWKED
ncbi:MAG: flavin prenyltransferase UbiX [bacterium]|nr:flavin prenyltransferase UbiX [bacterium]